MNIYIIVKFTIYNEDIFGAFETKEEAIEEARRLAMMENDDNPSFKVISIPLNALSNIRRDLMTGQHCEENTIFSVSRKMQTPSSELLQWG
jgi:hypothetical protein